MAMDKDGRPILTADDWKTGKDRNKEHLKHVAELERKRAWGTVLLLGSSVVAVYFLGWSILIDRGPDVPN